jgi:hypothetical protein
LKSRKIPLFQRDEGESSIEIPKGSPPFEKGRTGGISGKAFSKRSKVTEFPIDEKIFGWLMILWED